MYWGRRGHRECSQTESHWGPSGKRWPAGVVSWQTWCSCPRWRQDCDSHTDKESDHSSLDMRTKMTKQLGRVIGTGWGQEVENGLLFLAHEGPGPFILSYIPWSPTPILFYFFKWPKMSRLNSNMGSSYISMWSHAQLQSALVEHKYMKWQGLWKAFIFL